MASFQSDNPTLTIALIKPSSSTTRSYNFHSIPLSNSAKMSSQSLREAASETRVNPTQRRLPLAALFNLGTASGEGFP